MVVIFKLFVLRAHSTPPPPPPRGLNRIPLRAFKNDHDHNMICRVIYRHHQGKYAEIYGFS